MPFVNNRGVGRDDGGEGIDGRTKRADAGAEHDDRDRRQRVVAGGDHDGDDERVERERFLRHAVDGSSGGEERHENGNHPFLAPLEARHRSTDAGIDRAGPGDDAEEAADDQHEQRDVDRGGLIRIRVVEAGNRRDEHCPQSLRTRVDGLSRAWNRHLFVELFVLYPIILPAGTTQVAAATTAISAKRIVYAVGNLKLCGAMPMRRELDASEAVAKATIPYLKDEVRPVACSTALPGWRTRGRCWR